MVLEQTLKVNKARLMVRYNYNKPDHKEESNNKRKEGVNESACVFYIRERPLSTYALRGRVGVKEMTNFCVR